MLPAATMPYSALGISLYITVAVSRSVTALQLSVARDSSGGST